MEPLTVALSGFTRTNAIAYYLVSDIEKMSFVVLAPDPHQRVQHAAILPGRLTLHPGTCQDLQLSVLPWSDYFITVASKTLNTTIHSTTTVGKMTLSITTLVIMALSIPIKNVTLNNSTQHSVFRGIIAEGCYAYCCCIIVSPSK
jgi:hypothetical protein